MATKAISLHELLASAKLVSIHFIKTNGILESVMVPVRGRIRRQGGGRKYLPGLHPEWIDALKIVIESYTAEVPQ